MFFSSTSHQQGLFPVFLIYAILTALRFSLSVHFLIISFEEPYLISYLLSLYHFWQSVHLFLFLNFDRSCYVAAELCVYFGSIFSDLVTLTKTTTTTKISKKSNMNKNKSNGGKIICVLYIG